MFKFVSLALLLSLATVIDCTRTETPCDEERVAVAKAEYAGYLPDIKNIMYGRFRERRDTKFIPSRSYKDRHNYETSMNNCNGIKVTADLDNPTCYVSPNPKVYEVDFKDFNISMVCNWRATEEIPFWRDITSSGRMFVNRKLTATHKVFDGEGSSLKYVMVEKDETNFNPCINCQSYNKRTMLEYFGNLLLFGKATELTKNFPIYLKRSQEDKSLRFLQ